MLHMNWTSIPIAGALFFLTVSASAQTGAATKAPLSPQAQRGKQHYEKNCADCHLLTLRGSGHGPELAGPNFRRAWAARTSTDLLRQIQTTMPPAATQTLGEQAYIDIVAYIVQANGIGIGEADLAAATPRSLATGEAVAGKPSTWQSFQSPDTIDVASNRRSGFVNRWVQGFTSVTRKVLAAPPAADWLSWRRGVDGQGYSPLDQINAGTVQQLKLAWVLTMGEGSNQTTPLVRNGIMYLVHPGNVVQALDAASGELIWEYRHDYPPAAKTLGGPTRNIALYGDKVFMATYEAALVALDARSGELLWKTVKADYRDGFTHTSGPIIANGIVISGINGCERFVEDGCFITGHDPDTGAELWRTSTIALEGDVNNNSWGVMPPLLRGGGDTWIPGSYDPQLNLFYIGTSQAKPWVAASRGMTPRDKALYTNSTLALEPESGKIVWYYQHIGGETIDMEVGFERVLLDLDGRKLLVTVGKDGILWKLDRETGEFVDFVETIYQNIFATLDRKSGQVTYRQDILDATIGDSVSACPGIYGGHNWQATAYSPQTRALVIPLHQLCAEMVGREVELDAGGGGYGGDSRSFEMPGSEGMLGKLVAVDVDSMETLWSHQQRAMFLTSALTTAGGLVFIGDLDRYFNAFDVHTGKLVWRARLGSALHGFPITYAVGARQYVAVATGLGVFRALTSTISPDIYQPEAGNALYVFELPDSD
jgi:alcohol dehydrogenase (cytochrome c)